MALPSRSGLGDLVTIPAASGRRSRAIRRALSRERNLVGQAAVGMHGQTIQTDHTEGMPRRRRDRLPVTWVQTLVWFLFTQKHRNNTYISGGGQADRGDQPTRLGGVRLPHVCAWNGRRRQRLTVKTSGFHGTSAVSTSRVRMFITRTVVAETHACEVHPYAR